MVTRNGDRSDDEDEEEEEHDDDDEEALMEDIKQHAATLPTQEGKDSSEPALLSLEDHAKLHREAKARQKAAREKEGKTVKGSKATGKSKPSKESLVKQGSKKNVPPPVGLRSSWQFF